MKELNIQLNGIKRKLDQFERLNAAAVAAADAEERTSEETLEAIRKR